MRAVPHVLLPRPGLDDAAPAVGGAEPQVPPAGLGPLVPPPHHRPRSAPRLGDTFTAHCPSLRGTHIHSCLLTQPKVSTSAGGSAWRDVLLRRMKLQPALQELVVFAAHAAVQQSVLRESSGQCLVMCMAAMHAGPRRLAMLALCAGVAQSVAV